MHPVTTMKHWSHALHEGMLTMRHHIGDHLHSRHFWVGVGITLLLVGVAALLFFLSKHTPIMSPGEYPYSIPYTPYRF